eukprot:403336339
MIAQNSEHQFTEEIVDEILNLNLNSSFQNYALGQNEDQKNHPLQTNPHELLKLTWSRKILEDLIESYLALEIQRKIHDVQQLTMMKRAFEYFTYHLHFYLNLKYQTSQAKLKAFQQTFQAFIIQMRELIYQINLKLQILKSKMRNQQSAKDRQKPDSSFIYNQLMYNTKFYFKSKEQGQGYRLNGILNFEDFILSQELYQRMENTKIYLHLKNAKNILLSKADVNEKIPNLNRYLEAKGHPIRMDTTNSNFDQLFASPDLYMFKYLHQFFSHQFLPDSKLITHDQPIEAIVYPIPVKKTKRKYYHQVYLS